MNTFVFSKQRTDNKREENKGKENKRTYDKNRVSHNLYPHFYSHGVSPSYKMLSV